MRKTKKEKEKGKRRIISEEDKKFECQVEGCTKKCATPASRKNHVRFKHPEEFMRLYPPEGKTTPKEGDKDKSFRKGKRGSEGKQDKSGSGNPEGEGDTFNGWVPL